MAPTMVSSLSTPRVFARHCSIASAIAPRTRVAARVVSRRAPSSSSTPSEEEDDYYGPVVYTFSDDQPEFVRAEAPSREAAAHETSDTIAPHVAPGHDDAFAEESAVEVLRSANGDVMFRFTGDAAETYAAATDAEAWATEASVEAEPPAPPPPPPPTKSERAKSLLEEAQDLIEKAKKIESREDVARHVAEAAKAAADALAPDVGGAVEIRRGAGKGGGPVASTRAEDAGALAGLAAASRMGIKSVVDGIEAMFSNFRRTKPKPKRQTPTTDKNGVRLPQAPRDSPWAKEGASSMPPAGSALDAAFDAFGSADEKDADSPLMDAFALDADSEEAELAERVEEEHARWEETAAKALETGDLVAVVAATEEEEEEAPESALERYADMGEVVAGQWRPKPVDVTINGRAYIAYVTPNNLKQLPSGEYVIGTGEEEEASAAEKKEEEEGEAVPGDRVGETTTIIMCEPQADGTNVFMFGLTRTVLSDGSVLYRFPDGEAL
jgi:hypothetical protein